MDGASHLQPTVWQEQVLHHGADSEGLARGEVSSHDQRNMPTPPGAIIHTLTRPKPPGPTRDPAMKYPLMTG